MVIRTLAPYIGENMAGSAVRLQLAKLGLEGVRLTEEQIERLLAELAPALNVFIGRPKTQEAFDTIREELRVQRGSLP